MIDPAFRDRADAALSAIEREEGVRILLAIESGSRAWGFPSRDSDYDVRFVFARPLREHLRVSQPRDVIERPIDGDLDLGGWDLRKTLELMLRSNAVVGEWLASPVVYRCDPVAVAELRALARATAHLPVLACHYDRSARRAWAAGDGEVRMKAYLYALRAALVLRWVIEYGAPPPMDLPGLLGGAGVPDPVRGAIGDLVSRKATATEADTMARVPELERFLGDGLAVEASRPAPWAQPQGAIVADALFARLVMQTDP